jgi:predicted phage terminase large subunit-like protein
VAGLTKNPLRLIVSMPPRHGKSELLSHWLPVWFLLNHPQQRIGLASYSADFAATWGRKTRDTIVEYGAQFGLEVRRDLSSASLWQLTQGGGMMTAGVGGPFTGHGFDLLIIDDPIKNRQEAQSSLMRDNLWDWWRSTARTRLEPHGSIIVVMTRWHEEDLVGRLLAAPAEGEAEPGDDWEHLRLPALAEPDDPLGRAEGEPLWPGRYDIRALARLRQAVGPQDWAGLYQQRPAPLGGQLFKLFWWQLVDLWPPASGPVVQFWDTAFKTGAEHDYSACATVVPCAQGYLVRELWRERLEFPDLLRAVQNQAAQHRPQRIFIEDAASGQTLLQSLRRDTRLPVIGVHPLGDKVSRAAGITGVVEAGRVFLPQGAAWLSAFLDEISSFPHGAHDDQVDALVGALTQLLQSPGGYGGIYL